MSQAERDRLVALKKAKKKRITQKQAAEEIGVSERQVRRVLRKLRRKGDTAVKGRVERQFLTAQDRLVKGLRVAGASTIERANAYLEKEYLPWWNRSLVVAAADPADAHRPLGQEHDLKAILSHVETRQVSNDYTVHYAGKVYQIDRAEIRPGMRRAKVRVEERLDASITVRFQDHYVGVQRCATPLRGLIGHGRWPHRELSSASGLTTMAALESRHREQVTVYPSQGEDLNAIQVEVQSKQSGLDPALRLDKGRLGRGF